MANLLYFLADRIPQGLREIVIEYINNENLNYQKCFYSEKKSAIIEKIKWADVILFAPGRYLESEIMQEAKHIKLHAKYMVCLSDSRARPQSKVDAVN